MATDEQERAMQLTKQPARDSAEFARWLNGNLTLACGREMHYLCRGAISTIGIECPCLCKCHEEPRP